ncbi:hypothetical protein BFP72_01325 [Reichenbachiella sp. 5M10]|uniref:response regulator transcription factor n=1 Tax=Reichenbachiella sp. 5M10 TaxID=1889772 RepID=UPI000C1449F6|nr:response regulator transcription factor [Reichenbachiella sp. 5M10]PIB34164.1 hypothetical protein BFP72_01325 [Reichenbachiella sp. 5M10]
MKSKIEILIVDDHKMFLEGLSSILSSEEHIHVAAILTEGREALAYLDRHHVDLVMTDISMPIMDGVELNAALKKHPVCPKTLVVSTESNPPTIQKLIKGGADGYLLKNAEKKELLTAIERIAEGGKYFSKEVQDKYTESLFATVPKVNVHAELSKREKEILSLIVEEYTAHEIAEKLFISQHTVNTHRKNLLSKLGVKNTAGLVKHTIINGLLK